MLIYLHGLNISWEVVDRYAELETSTKWNWMKVTNEAWCVRFWASVINQSFLPIDPFHQTSRSRFGLGCVYPVSVFSRRSLPMSFWVSFFLSLMPYKQYFFLFSHRQIQICYTLSHKKRATNKIKEMKTTTNFNKQTNKHTTLNDKKNETSRKKSWWGMEIKTTRCKEK